MQETSEHEITDIPRDPVQQMFPAAVARAVDLYTDFSSRTVPDAAKEVTGFHTACKAAIAHITALIKLEKLCGSELKPISENIEDLLRQTRQVLLNTKAPDDIDPEDQL